MPPSLELDRAGEAVRAAGHAGEREGIAGGVEFDHGVAIADRGFRRRRVMDGGRSRANRDGVRTQSTRDRRDPGRAVYRDGAVAAAADDGFGVVDGDAVGRRSEDDGVVAGPHIEDGTEALLGHRQRSSDAVPLR